MSQKLENLLNLALDADQGERERSEELDVGYDKEENVWELIVNIREHLKRSGKRRDRLRNC